MQFATNIRLSQPILKSALEKETRLRAFAPLATLSTPIISIAVSISAQRTVGRDSCGNAMLLLVTPI
jgi:hypothetical protein